MSELTISTFEPWSRKTAIARPADQVPPVVAGEWGHLSPLGEYRHPVGRQVIDAAATAALQKHLQRRTLLARVPVYLGHPDDPRFSGDPGHDNPAVQGFVRELVERPDGLWVRLEWTAAGRQVRRTGHLRHLSPRWRLQALGGGRYRPIRLLSVGLTDSPNLPTQPLS